MKIEIEDTLEGRFIIRDDWASHPLIAMSMHEALYAIAQAYGYMVGWAPDRQIVQILGREE